jgi:hypothetical protein
MDRITTLGFGRRDWVSLRKTSEGFPCRGKDKIDARAYRKTCALELDVDC